MRRDTKCLGTLPEGYEYKAFNVDGVIKILGIHPDKKPIGAIVNGDKLDFKELEPEYMADNTRLPDNRPE
jgi:hypothetical protein